MPVIAVVYIGHSRSDVLNVSAYASRALMDQSLCTVHVQGQIHRNHKKFGHV